MFKQWLPAMVVFAAALPAGATTTYATYGAMTAANPGLTFTAVDFTTGSGIGTSTYTSLNGVTFSENNGNLVTGSFAGWSGTVLKGQQDGTTITITLPSTATAFGGFFGQAGSSFFSTLTVVAVGDTTVNQTFNGPGATYFGFVSSTPFTTITLYNDTKTPAVNQFVFGTPTSTGGGGDTGGTTTPEPSSLALMGGALIAIPILARRRRK